MTIIILIANARFFFTLFNGKSIFLGNLLQKPPLKKNSSGII